MTTTPRPSGRRRPAALLVALLAVVALAAAACGDDDSADGATTTAGGSGGDMALTIGYSAWPGWFPLAVADEKGIFAEHGLDVDLKYFTDYTASLDALVAGQVDVNAQTLNDTIFGVASGADQRVVVVNDNSTGNDQIICDQSITSVQDMKGKTVAAEAGVVDHFLLLQGLTEEGLTEDDIEFKGVKTDAAAAAFAGGEFDCVGVFAPFTVQAMERPGAHVLFSSKDFPGVIPDHLVATAEAAGDTEAMQALVDAWYATLEWIAANPEEARSIMAEKAGVSDAEYAEFDAGTTLFTREQAMNAFEDRAGDPTSLPEMARRINPFLVESGLAEEEADLSELFLPEFTEKASTGATTTTAGG
ncbi:aliphatic sulfonate ABC transporter substrate-binding protein [Dermatobacter hominis]|uniref:aliphatic sulfonate ABC transporter substrate-binding protein n=1 Tax=Dermatobacter hominis TaxID=2884263 RepID=UPI001D10AE9B|nr:aliphatic sulfonate ABC transporter substrate-binding protein [Dermatobacter hominis]UDY35280.1 aliphatic sulfonate ABC transporter substrate-binding protein [Dermatobacter hominis]